MRNANSSGFFPRLKRTTLSFLACCKTWTGFVKHGFVKGGFVKHGFVEGGFVKHGFLKGGFVNHGFAKHGFVKGGFVKHGLTWGFSLRLLYMY